jgi:hypothetical protein
MAAGSQTWIFGIGELALPAYQQFISTRYQVYNHPTATAGADFGRSEEQANYQTNSAIHPGRSGTGHAAIFKNLLFSIFFVYFR